MVAAKGVRFYKKRSEKKVVDVLRKARDMPTHPGQKQNRKRIFLWPLSHTPARANSAGGAKAMAKEITFFQYIVIACTGLFPVGRGAAQNRAACKQKIKPAIGSGKWK